MELCQGDSSRNPEPETRRAQSRSIIIVCDRDRFILAWPTIRRFPPPPPRISPFQLYVRSNDDATTRARLKETKKNLYLFYFSPLFFHRYFPRDKLFYSLSSIFLEFSSTVRGDSLRDF